MKKIKEYFKALRVPIGLLIIVISFGFGVILPFSHPDMTATRLFIEFWPFYLVEVLIMILGGFLAKIR